jgi:hypothetical protein
MDGANLQPVDSWTSTRRFRVQHYNYSVFPILLLIGATLLVFLLFTDALGSELVTTSLTITLVIALAALAFYAMTIKPEKWVWASAVQGLLYRRAYVRDHNLVQQVEDVLRARGIEYKMLNKDGGIPKRLTPEEASIFTEVFWVNAGGFNIIIDRTTQYMKSYFTYIFIGPMSAIEYPKGMYLVDDLNRLLEKGKDQYWEKCVLPRGPDGDSPRAPSE